MSNRRLKFVMAVPEQHFALQKAQVLRRLGHDVLVIDERKEYLLPGFLGRRKVVRKLIKVIRPLKRLSIRALNRRIVRAMEELHPDALYLEKGKLVTARTLARAGELGVSTMNWFPDDLQEFAWVKSHAASYDLFCTFDSYVRDELVSAGLANVRYLPFGATPPPQEDAPVSGDYDVAFVGARYPERERLLSLLAERFRVRIWGWRDWGRSALKHCYQGPADPSKLYRIFRASRINLNVHFASRGHGANVRSFEIPAAGGFQLCDYRADIPGLFTPDREIALFRNDEELLAKAAEYLDDEARRRSVARAGHARFLRDHTMENRVRALLGMAGLT